MAANYNYLKKILVQTLVNLNKMYTLNEFLLLSNLAKKILETLKDKAKRPKNWDHKI